METKYVKVPFEVELAKKITNGEVKGRIITRDGRIARVICFDRKSINLPIVALMENEPGLEEFETYTLNGMWSDGNDDLDLMLQIPEYMTFKDGDVIYAESIFGSDFIFVKKEDSHKTSKHVSLMNRIDLSFENCHCCEDDNIKILRKATNEETQTMINALRVSKHECAKEYLKRFFNIEVKPECEFKPFDKVLVRDSKSNEWKIDIFREFTEDGDKCGYKYNCFYDNWNFCIPYNEKTAHLLGTTDNWEEKI